MSTSPGVPTPREDGKGAGVPAPPPPWPLFFGGGGAGKDFDVFRAEGPATVAAGHFLQADISRDLDALDDLLLPGGGRATSGEPNQDETGAQADQADRDPAGGPLRAEGAVDKQETEEDQDGGGDIGDDPSRTHGGNLPSCEAV